MRAVLEIDKTKTIVLASLFLLLILGVSMSLTESPKWRPILVLPWVAGGVAVIWAYGWKKGLLKTRGKKIKLKTVGSSILQLAGVSIIFIGFSTMFLFPYPAGAAVMFGLLGLIILIAGLVISRGKPAKARKKKKKKAKPKKKYCENCDLELPPDAEFCPDCGGKVKELD